MVDIPSPREEWFEASPGRPVLIRPIRPQDQPAHERFFARLSAADVQMRFFHPIRELQPEQLERFTHIDPRKEMAFIATEETSDGQWETLGVARMVIDATDPSQAEFAVVVRSDLKRRGLGRTLLERMIRYCREAGLRRIYGEVLAENEAMLHLGKSLGFHAVNTSHGVVEVRLELNEPQ